MSSAQPAHPEQRDSLAAARLALFELHKDGDRLAEAQQVLEDLERALAPTAVERMDVAVAYERLGQRDRALKVREAFDRNGGEPGDEGRMKLAYLYESVGRREQALATWQALWGEQVSAAQRSIVEDRIMTLAAGLGVLDEIAVTLEARHLAGTASPDDSSLLVRLYVRAAEQALLAGLGGLAARQTAAIEVIDEFFAQRGADQIQILDEQADVYRTLRDYTAFDGVMRRLSLLDPSNEPRYLRSRILNQLDSQGEERITEIRHLLQALRASEGRVAAGQFEAGVLSLAGFTDEAIVAYRRAIVLAPDGGESHLLLGDALKKQGREDEAVAHFQHLAANTLRDNVFVAAIDGVMNTLVAGRDEQTATLRSRAVLRWSQRRVLERLLVSGDAPHLYAIFAELADASNDPQHSLPAVENSLTLAEGRRASVLRELMTLVGSGEEAFGLHTLRMGDYRAASRLAYGGRLLALREALPPDVYMNIGKEFLERRDTAGASRAFHLAADTTGRLDVLMSTAHIYDETGFEAEAVHQYRLASIADRDNVSVMLKLAHLLERMGHRDEAHEIDGRGLKTILSRQMAHVPGDNPVVTPADQELKTHYEESLRGWLATWPDDPAVAAASIAEFERWFESELASTSGTPTGTLTSHPRLDWLTRLLTRAALASGYPKVAERVGSRLIQRFPADRVLIRFLEDQWRSWGFSGFSGDGRTVAQHTSFAAVLAEAEQTGAYTAALNLSLLNADQNQILAVARAWARTGSYVEAVAWADHGRLNEQNFRSLCRYVMQLIRKNHAAWDGVWESLGIKLLERLESVTAEPVFTSVQLRAMRHGILPDAYPYVIARLGDDYRTTLLRQIATPASPWAPLAFWRELLKRPLEANSAHEVSVTMKALFDNAPQVFARDMPDLMTEQLLEPDLHVANVELAAQVMADWQQRGGGTIDYVRPLILLKTGRLDQALDEFLGVAASVMDVFASGRDTVSDSVMLPFETLQTAFLPRYEKELRALLNLMETSQGASEELAELRVRALYRPWTARVAEEITFLEKASARYPNNELFLARLQGLYQSQGELAKAVDALERLYRLNPGERRYRAHLFAAYLGMNRSHDASRLNAASPENMDDPRFFTLLVFYREQERPNGSATQLLVLNKSAVIKPRGSSGKLLAAPVTVTGLEDALRSAPIEEEGRIYSFYDHLAKAYVREGRAAEKLALLSRRIYDDLANLREFVLWLALVEMQGAKSVEIAGVLDRRLAHATPLLPRHLMSMARVYATLGLQSRAVDVYRRAAIHAFGGAFLGDSDLTAIELIGEATRLLEPRYRQRVVGEVAQLLQRGPEAPPAVQQAYQSFLAEAWAMAPDRQEARAGNGRITETLPVLAPVPRKPPRPDSSQSARLVEEPSAHEVAVQRYVAMLGGVAAADFGLSPAP